MEQRLKISTPLHHSQVRTCSYSKTLICMENDRYRYNTHREYPKFEIILLNTKIIERISFLADNQILDSYEKENVKISHEALLFHDTFIWKFILKLHSL